MIVALSTSSPVASVALLSEEGQVIAAGRRTAPMAACGASLGILRDLLRQSGRRLADATLFAADLGPGSFTGVRVGVTLAKTWAFAAGVPAAGATSFDLISPDSLVMVPSKRGEFHKRVPGERPVTTTAQLTEGVLGYGFDEACNLYPDAARFGILLPNLERLAPEKLLPFYLSGPSISVPKKPYGPGAPIA